jgi:hypothetical protein
MKKLMPIVALVCRISSVVAAAAETQSEGMEIAMGPEWKPAFSAHTRKLTHLEFIRVGADIDNCKVFHLSGRQT